MTSNGNIPPEIHFHILWSSSPEVDFMAFPTREEAEAAARGMVRLNETYTIVETDEKCERCKDVAKLARSGH